MIYNIIIISGKKKKPNIVLYSLGTANKQNTFSGKQRDHRGLSHEREKNGTERR